MAGFIFSEIEGVTLSVRTRRPATPPRPALAGLPPGLALDLATTWPVVDGRSGL